MRLFAAVQPPEPVLDRLDAAIKEARTDWPALRWAGRAQWRITLAFYGELDAARLPRLTRRLARAAGRTASLRLALTGAGTFPAVDRARVLWAGVRGDVDDLRELADSAAAAGHRVGAPHDRKAFRPHLTLARCRTPADLRTLVTALNGLESDPWQAAELLLIESHTGPRPRYETLHAWPLAGSAQ